MNKIMAIILLPALFCLATASPAGAATVEYIYDDLNRVKDVIYTEGSQQAKITYTQDKVNNRQTEVADSDNDTRPDSTDNFPTEPGQ